MALRARLWAIPGQQGGEETDFGGAIRAPLFLGLGPYPEGEGWAWVRASRDGRLTVAQVAHNINLLRAAT